MNNLSIQSKLLKLLNGNIISPHNYTDKEIHDAFLKTNFKQSMQRERKIYDCFFLECTPEELETLIDTFEVNIRGIKKLYESSPYRQDQKTSITWDKRFRLAKLKPPELSRQEDKYEEIDQFGKYELTPCIAYEMAIRNEEVKKLLKRYDKISSLLEDDQYIMPAPMSLGLFRFTKGVPENKDLKEQGITEQEIEKEYEEYKELSLIKQSNYAKVIANDYKGFIDNHIDKCTELTIATLSELRDILTDELINKYLIYPKGYQRKFPNSNILVETIKNNQEEQQNHYYDKNIDEPIVETIIHEEFKQIQGLYADSDKYFVNNIVPNFKRQVNDQEQMTMPINFSLPLDEIIEYITVVKKKLNNKSPLEILEETLQKADDISNLNSVDERGKHYKLDATKGESSQNKLAHMMYIYDMKQLGVSNEHIISELNTFDINKKTSVDNSTVTNYYKIAKDYIEYERYKELITGKSTL